jgi:hypothetical protein
MVSGRVVRYLLLALITCDVGYMLLKAGLDAKIEAQEAARATSERGSGSDAIASALDVHSGLQQHAPDHQSWYNHGISAVAMGAAAFLRRPAQIQTVEEKAAEARLHAAAAAAAGAAMRVDAADGGWHTAGGGGTGGGGYWTSPGGGLAAAAADGGANKTTVLLWTDTMIDAKFRPPFTDHCAHACRFVDHFGREDWKGSADGVVFTASLTSRQGARVGYTHLPTPAEFEDAFRTGQLKNGQVWVHACYEAATQVGTAPRYALFRQCARE